MKVLLPENIEDLLNIISDEPGSAIYAGGTDLLVKLRAGMVTATTLVCLERIEELRGIRDEEESLFIGSCTTLTALLENKLIRENAPVLQKAIHTLGSPPIRNMGTIGGNICTASPAGDTLPPLYILDAEVELLSRRGSRSMEISRFILGPGTTAIGKGEILAGIRVKKTRQYSLHHFEKVGQRKALAISIASLAALIDTDRSGIITKTRLAWGSVGPTTTTAPEAEAALIGQPLTIDSLRSVRHLVEKAVAPISDIRATAAYRKEVASNLILRLSIYGHH